MKKLLGLAGFLATIGVSGCLLTQLAFAANCNVNFSACAYFTDQKGAADDNVLPGNALNGINSANAMITRIDGFLFSGDPHSKYGAAFIVDWMLHYKNGANPAGGGQAAGLAYARNNFNTWKALINFYGSPKNGSYGINWNYLPTRKAFCGNGTKHDTAYDLTLNDVIWYHIQAYDGASCQYEYSASMPEIQFFWHDNNGNLQTFDIGKLCGNVQDSIAPPPLDHAPTGSLTLACDASAGTWTVTATIDDQDAATTGYVTVLGSGWKPALVDGANPPIAIPASDAPALTAVTVQVYANDTGPVASGSSVLVASQDTVPPCQTVSCGSVKFTSATAVDPYMNFDVTVTVDASGGVPPPGNPPIDLTIKPRAPNNYNYAGSVASTGSGGTSTGVFTNIPSTSTAGDKTGGRYDVTWKLGSTTCSGTLDIVNLPYVNIYGGDAFAGASPTYDGSSSSCDQNNNGGFYSWNLRSPGYSGAGAQYAVMALGAIDDFASALSSNNTKPDGLSYANTYAFGGAAKDNPASGLFGGYFGDPTGSSTGSCDFTSDIKSAAQSGAAVTAAITAMGMPIGAGSQIVKYADSDVYISKDIKYNIAGWATVADVPSFRLVVVGGDIYIDNNVAQLDGLYVAEPSDAGVGGHIYTCASAIGTVILPMTANYYNLCHTQLQINGAFVAQQVWFGRTFGTVGQSKTDTLNSNNDAEVFKYSPELWLPRSSTAPDGGYAAITGLPPIL